MFTVQYAKALPGMHINAADPTTLRAVLDVEVLMEPTPAARVAHVYRIVTPRACGMFHPQVRWDDRSPGRFNEFAAQPSP